MEALTMLSRTQRASINTLLRVGATCEGPVELAAKLFFQASPNLLR